MACLDLYCEFNCDVTTMLQLQSYIFPFSGTLISRAHTFMFRRSLSAFSSSTLKSFSISSEVKIIKSASNKHSVFQGSLIIGYHNIISASFSTLISLGLNGHINSSFQGSTTYRILSNNMSSYQTEQRGSLYSDDFRLYIKDSTGAIVSAFHDIPLK